MSFDWRPPKPVSLEEWRQIGWREGLMAWRGDLLSRAEGDVGFQAECLSRAMSDPVWWFDAFLMTNAPLDAGATRHVPFVLYPTQERFVRWMHPRIAGGSNALVDKSRAMGMTWIMLDLLLHAWLFDPNALLLVGTLTLDKLEGTSEDVLLPKLDYTMERLPSWMLPPGWVSRHPWRRPCLFKNPVTGAEILGEACTRNFGRSGRRTYGWVDEAGEIARLDEALSGCSATVAGLALTSTPRGRGNTFGQVRFGSSYEIWTDVDDEGPGGGYRWGRPGMHWTQHPLHSAGLYLCGAGCKVHPDGGVPHSPWYDEIATKLNHSAVDLAQQLDLNYTLAGRGVFSDVCVQAALEWLDAHPPGFVRYELDWDRPGAGSSPSQLLRSWRGAGVVATEVASGNLRVLRPPVFGHVYVLGGDVSTNADGGSASVGTVWDATDGLVVAEWYGRRDPDDVGLEWAKLARWYSPSGSRPAWRCYCCVERNGPGAIVVKVLDLCGCLVHCHVNEGRDPGKVEDRLGVILTRHNRERHILENLVPSVNKTGVDGLPVLRDPFREFWREAEAFACMETGAASGMRGDGVRMGVPKGCLDDRVFSRCHMLYGCRWRYGRLSGVVAKGV